MQVFYETGVFPLRGMIGRQAAEQGSFCHALDRIERAWLLLEEVRTTYRNHPNKVNRRRLADAVDRFHEVYGMPAKTRRPSVVRVDAVGASAGIAAGGCRA